MSVGIGIIGIGTVGSGCLEILQNHHDDFQKHYDVDIAIKRICSRSTKNAQLFGLESIFTSDYHEVINDPDIDIVVELVGGTEIAHSIVAGALKAGKHVVTANKALMATKGEEIFELAQQNNVEIMYEASVGGAIPIIGPLQHSLVSNEIQTIMGIVNGTTNYMLTRIAKDGMTYDEALKEAQEKGFAEADPSADVDGFDAAAKISILASIAFNARVNLSDVHTEGIRNISPVDLKNAHDMGYAVKLLALAHLNKDGIDVRVHPTMIPLSHQMAHVNGVDNAVYVTGDACGEAMFFGAGAGSLPAASAVMTDVIDMARRVKAGQVPGIASKSSESYDILDIEQLTSRYYIRFVVPDRIGILAKASHVFSSHDVSLRSVMQEGVNSREKVDLVIVTHRAIEANINKVLKELKECGDMLLDEPVVLRLEE